MSTKHGLRKRLWTLGFDISRFNPESHPVARWRQRLEACRIGVVLDVGANVGQWAQELREDVGYNGRIRSFEPMSAAFEALQARAAQDPDWEAFHFALGDAEGNVTINIAQNSHSSSILEMLPAHEAAAPESVFVGQEEVTLRTLDGIFDEVCLPGDRVYLKIDTQGYEGCVLSGARRSLPKIDVVQLEMPLAPLYAGERSLVELLELMLGEGYELIALDPGFTDPRTGRLLQVDGVFQLPHEFARASSSVPGRGT